MIYLVTSIITLDNGRKVFDPTFDTEVFTSYFKALRWLYVEYKQAVSLEYRVWREVPHFRGEFGRQEMFALCYRTDSGSYRVAISRINTEGHH